MSCLTTLVTEAVNTCIGLLTIGTISATNQDVVIELTNTATGRIDIFTATSSGAGLVIANLTDFELLAKSSYLIKVENANTQSPYDITIGGDMSQAIVMPVEIQNGDAFSNITLVGA